MMHLLRKYDVAPLRFAMMRCLPLCAGVCPQTPWHYIIRRSRHHLAPANIICRRQTSLKKTLAIASAFFWLPLTCLHVFGHRTMRQTSSLAALVLSAPFGRAGWSVRVQEEESTKKPRRLAWFPLAPPAGLEPATP